MTKNDYDENEHLLLMNSLFCEFLLQNLEGFTTKLITDYTNLTYGELEDPLFNMTWGNDNNSKNTKKSLSRLSKRLGTLISAFSGELGALDAEIVAHLYATQKLVESSAETYGVYFGHETRGKPNWSARLVADICFVAIEKCGRKPTFGTEYDSADPTGEYGKLVKDALIFAEIDADWNSPAKWAFDRRTNMK